MAVGRFQVMATLQAARAYVLGKPVDEAGEIKATKFYPIHRKAPAFTEEKGEIEILETGIKSIDLLSFAKRRQGWIIRGSRRR